MCDAEGAAPAASDQLQETRAETGLFQEGKTLTATGLLSDMYFNTKTIDPQNVSLQSSFICMLHLANEKGLQFTQESAFGDALQ